MTPYEGMGYKEKNIEWNIKLIVLVFAEAIQWDFWRISGVFFPLSYVIIYTLHVKEVGSFI